jgi:hypothetical protein
VKTASYAYVQPTFPIQIANVGWEVYTFLLINNTQAVLYLSRSQQTPGPNTSFDMVCPPLYTLPVFGWYSDKLYIGSDGAAIKPTDSISIQLAEQPTPFPNVLVSPLGTSQPTLVGPTLDVPVQIVKPGTGTVAQWDTNGLLLLGLLGTDRIGITKPNLGGAPSIRLNDFWLLDDPANGTHLVHNAYFDGVNWRYFDNGNAQLLKIAPDNTFTFYLAPSGNAGAVVPGWTVNAVLGAAVASIPGSASFGSLTVTGLHNTGSETIDGDLTVSGKIANSVSCGALVQVTNFSVGDNVDQIIPWTSAIANTDAMWDAGTPSRLTAKRPGWYVTTVQVELAGNINATIDAAIIANDAQTIVANTNENTIIFTMAGMYYLNTNDYLQFRFRQAKFNATQYLSGWFGAVRVA